MRYITPLFLFVFFLVLAPTPAQSAPLSISSVVDADFDVVIVTGGTFGDISLGTNDSITYGSGYTGAGIGTAGRLTLDGDPGFDVEVFCDSTATLANSGGDTMPINEVEVVADINGTGAFGTGNTCQGSGTSALVFTIQASSADNRFSYGVQIDGSGGVPGGDGAFSTSNPSGDPVSVTFQYQ